MYLQHSSPGKYFHPEFALGTSKKYIFAVDFEQTYDSELTV